MTTGSVTRRARPGTAPRSILRMAILDEHHEPMTYEERDKMEDHLALVDEVPEEMHQLLIDLWGRSECFCGVVALARLAMGDRD